VYLVPRTGTKYLLLRPRTLCADLVNYLLTAYCLLLARE